MKTGNAGVPLEDVLVCYSLLQLRLLTRKFGLPHCFLLFCAPAGGRELLHWLVFYDGRCKKGTTGGLTLWLLILHREANVVQLVFTGYMTLVNITKHFFFGMEERHT